MARRQIGVTIESMTGSPHGVTPGGSWPPPSGPPPTWPPTPPRNSRLPAIISLAIATLAIAVAVGAWFRPINDHESSRENPIPQFSERDIADATEIMCGAYEKAVKAVVGASGSQTEPDPLRSFIMSVDARFAFHVTAEYFISELGRNPATPTQLAEDFRELAATYDELILAQLARTPEQDLQPIYDRTDRADARVVEACR